MKYVEKTFVPFMVVLRQEKTSCHRKSR